MLIVAERASPATPAAGYSVLYPKADGQWYFKDDAGVEQLLTSGGIQQNLLDAKGDLVTASAADTPARLPIGPAGSIAIARPAATTGFAYSSALKGLRYGNTYAHNAVDITNDWDIAEGGCMDSTRAYWIETAALTKQADAIWAVGNNAGLVDLVGSLGNNNFYLFAIARSDTGVTDYLASLSSTAPTMPVSYDFKRLIGWYIRVAGVNVLLNIYETEGGGLELLWRAPTADINVVNTLTTARRLDAIKVPLNFSVIARVVPMAVDSTAGFVRIECPDATDVATNSDNSNLRADTPASSRGTELLVRTSATGTIATRSSIATVDTYFLRTIGFTWDRRN